MWSSWEDEFHPYVSKCLLSLVVLSVLIAIDVQGAIVFAFMLLSSVYYLVMIIMGLMVNTFYMALFYMGLDDVETIRSIKEGVKLLMVILCLSVSLFFMFSGVV